MPAATPVPHVPAVLLLGSATDLLTGPGCSVCRYASQASEDYLAWFCFEGHAQADTITRLCASPGTCSRHTRRLMRQPGAAIRLTAVYRYVMAAAQERLAGPARPLARCPACEHDRDAADQAVQILADDAVPSHRGEKCGQRWPVRRRASRAGGRRQVEALLARPVEELAADLTGHPARPVRRPASRRRSRLRRIDGPAGCPACLAAEDAELRAAELDEAFGKNTWLRRHEARGPEMSAWRHAAAFLDGHVFCGGPPGG